jgi:hypothetical protein
VLKSRASNQRSPGDAATYLPMPRQVLSRPGCRGPRRAALGTALALILAGATACSGNDSPRPLAATATATSTPAASPSSATSSASAPDATTQAIRDATAAYDKAYIAAIADPKNTTKSRTLLAMYTDTSPERAGITQFLQSLAAKGLAGAQGPNGHQTIEQIAIISWPPDGKAEATLCTYDDGLIVDAVNRAPDGSQIIVNDDKQSYRTRYTWNLLSGQWKIADTTTITTWHGEDRCAPG